MKKIKNITEEELNYNIKDLKIEEIYPNSIDNVIVNIINGESITLLPSNMSSDNFRKWVKGRGGIFKKDITKFSKGKPTGRYILIEGKEERKIVRLIEDDEIKLFESQGLIDGKIKDKPYMLIRSLKPEQNLTSLDRYINDIPDIIEEPEEETNETPENMPPRIEEDSESHNLLLFTD